MSNQNRICILIHLSCFVCFFKKKLLCSMCLSFFSPFCLSVCLSVCLCLSVLFVFLSLFCFFLFLLFFFLSLILSSR